MRFALGSNSRISVVLSIALLTLSAASVAAQDVPNAAYKAKTYWIENKTGKPMLENGADQEMSKWGRLTMADDAESADIRLVISKSGSTEIDKVEPTQDGKGLQESSSTSFTFGVQMRAYVKGQALYFWSGDATGTGEKAGKSLVDNFKKLYPKD